MSDDLNLDELERRELDVDTGLIHLEGHDFLKLIALARKGLDYQPPEVARAREIEGDKACEWYRIEQARAERYKRALQFYAQGHDGGTIAREALEEKS